MTAIGLEGKRFGKLIAGKPVRVNGTWKYACVCDCGREKLIAGSSLSSGLTRSCGCIAASMKGGASPRFKHGMTGSVEYVAWQNMIGRCEDQRDKEYANYGGRGISVCAEWRSSFQSFLDHVGKRPITGGYSLDRIDVEGNYEPGNVRWADPKTQASNKRKLERNTHCGYCHEFTPENTYTFKGYRYCNECRKRLKRESYHRRTAIQSGCLSE